MVITDPGEGMAELNQQIAKLMAASIHPDWAEVPPVSQVVPRNVTADGSALVGVPPVTQTPIMAGVVLAR